MCKILYKFVNHTFKHILLAFCSELKHILFFDFSYTRCSQKYQKLHLKNAQRSFFFYWNSNLIFLSHLALKISGTLYNFFFRKLCRFLNSRNLLFLYEYYTSVSFVVNRPPKESIDDWSFKNKAFISASVNIQGVIADMRARFCTWLTKWFFPRRWSSTHYAAPVK